MRRNLFYLYDDYAIRLAADITTKPATENTEIRRARKEPPHTAASRTPLSQSAQK